MGDWSKSVKVLVFLFLVTLLFVNPWVRGDGVGYYSYVRSLLIDGDLNFENEWRAGNTTFILPKLDEQVRLRQDVFTATGRVDNHFSVGPAILWAPFLILVHLAVFALNAMGAAVPADGYSAPYVWTMGFATALYGFLGLCLAFALAREYVEERWAFLATLGIWFGSSLPVYMYFNPSWSHAHGAFAVALFLWYWQRTRNARSALQWITLGLLAGLMMNVYYPNAVALVVPLLESLNNYWQRCRGTTNRWAAAGRLLLGNVLFALATLLAFLPTLVTRKIIYGDYLASGYPGAWEWNWTKPVLAQVLFSSNHGLLSWTPVLLLALLGLPLLAKRDREFGLCLMATFVAFYYLIASYPTWHGISAFGNRFFVSLTPLFVLGLAALLQALAGLAGQTRALWTAAATLALLILWNGGLVFQWGTHMIPPRGPISWREAAYNQVAVVPVRIWGSMKSYLLKRRATMEQIERHDAQKLYPAQAEEK